MFTTLLTIVFSQVPYGPQAQWGWDGTVHNRTGWGYRELYGRGYYPVAAFYGSRCGPSGCCSSSRATWYYTSPWNAAVAELRAAGPRRSSDKRPPPSTIANLEFLALKTADAYSTLRAAEPQDKSELRAQWMDARRQLEQARYRAAKEARR
jgi:hypothetical protein